MPRSESGCDGASGGDVVAGAGAERGGAAGGGGDVAARGAGVGAAVIGGGIVGAAALRVARICSTSSPEISILLISVFLFVCERPRLSTVIVCSRAATV